MDSIFHEKQEGSLCAQHCLNALLQGPYFTAVDLAELASQLDEMERAELDNSSNSQASHNVNEEGYFSIQVINKALSIWSLEMLPFLQQSSQAQAARDHPERQQAFICNFRNHWFCIRRFGEQWFDLNSMITKPRLISTTYLTIYLAQLQQEGHSIFFIVGTLPDCEAEHLISLCPVPERFTRNSSDSHEQSSSSEQRKHPADDDEDDDEMKVAMALCREESDQENISLQRVLESSRLEAQEMELRRALELSASQSNSSPDDMALAEAIALSLQSGQPEAATSTTAEPTPEEIRSKRQKFLDSLSGNPPSGSS